MKISSSATTLVLEFEEDTVALIQANAMDGTSIMVVHTTIDSTQIQTKVHRFAPAKHAAYEHWSNSLVEKALDTVDHEVYGEDRASCLKRIKRSKFYRAQR